MRILTASIVIGPLMLAGTLPAAGPSMAADAPIRPAATSDATSDRDTYAQRARDEMQEWRRKLHDFDETAEAKGRKAGDAAEKDLHAAWTRVEAAGHKLQTASAENWERAKVSFEKASHELSDAWDKARSQDK